MLEREKIIKLNKVEACLMFLSPSNMFCVSES